MIEALLTIPFTGCMGITDSRYIHLPKLLQLEAVGAHQLYKGGPARPLTVSLPLHHWEPFLRVHPDAGFAEFIRRGITWGFRIGYSRGAPAPCPAQDNLRSALANPAVIDNYITEEIKGGKLLVAAPGAYIHCSPIGIIPKPHQAGKYRLIVDLSSPREQSINDGIDEDLSSVQYANVDDATRILGDLGKGALMAKLDLKAAYRMVPVHEHDRVLLGISWQGRQYMDTALPFGLRSAPLLFTAVADGLAWAMFCSGIEYVIHYLDDFFVCAPPSDHTQCQFQLQFAIQLCERLGLPVAMHKVEGPSSVLTFLGLELDSLNQEVRLPQYKLVGLQGRA